MELSVQKLDGGSAGKLTVSETVFGLEPRADILSRMVAYQMAKRQQGTHQTKGRSDIARTGAKMYRQKGTGNARHHAASAPQFRGGGKAHGPQARSHATVLPKKVRALALKHALSAKAQADELIIVDDLVTDGKTSGLAKSLKGLSLDNALVIGGSAVEANFSNAASNIPNIDVLPVQGINVYDILRRNKLVLSKAAVEALEERFK
ncbi:MAG: 50S ribosomal protein L4 [Pseudomonadota bacterium]